MPGTCQRLWESRERPDLTGRLATGIDGPGDRAGGLLHPDFPAEALATMHIRPERPGDAPTLHALIEAAFRGRPYSDGAEPRVVDALRAAGALTLSLVATQADEILGHIAFSPVTINGAASDWYGLGPVAVWPDRQERGTGQALVREGLRRLQAMGASGCVLLGDPAYYARFGFENDPGLRHAHGPAWAFQRLILRGPALQGDVEFHPAFDTP
jgi:predicted N-acetyltransferase YhbS